MSDPEVWMDTPDDVAGYSASYPAESMIVVPVIPDDATIERVARALNRNDGDWSPLWEQLTESGKDEYRAEARVAIEALHGEVTA